MLELKNFIDGRMSASISGRWMDNVSPSTGAVYSQVCLSDGKDVDLAVEAARRAFPLWSSLKTSERADFLYKIADRIEARFEEFVRAETVDQGKPITLSRNLDIPRSIQNFRFFAEAINQMTSISTEPSSAILNYVRRQPLGVVALISPWNLPLYLLTWKLAPALAMGNVCLAKPSELTPYTATLLMECLNEVGLPPGVVNLLHGRGNEVGEAIVTNPHVKAVSFTGGTVTGRRIETLTAGSLKKLSLELGGKNPTIVFEDADLSRCIPVAVRSAFLNQGEICLCGSRIFIQKNRMDAFVEQFVNETKKFRCGDPLHEKTTMGALISENHRSKVLRYIALAKELGGDVMCGGTVPDLPGFFVEPTVVTGLSAECVVNQEEIFGPVVSLIPFETEEEVLEMANGTDYGLSASIWTQNLSRAHLIANQLQVGTVWINTWLSRDLRMPFGGMKSSGLGREGGLHSLDFFSEPKTICIELSH